MYVRLAFAVAAHLEPEILIVDEVLAVGDAEFQKKCLGKMGEVAEEGRTVLFVSHNMPAVQALCARAILLRAGTVAVDGSTGEVLREYLGHLLATAAHAFEDNPDRRGDGSVRLTAARVLDEEGRPVRAGRRRKADHARVLLREPDRRGAVRFRARDRKSSQYRRGTHEHSDRRLLHRGRCRGRGHVPDPDPAPASG